MCFCSLESGRKGGSVNDSVGCILMLFVCHYKYPCLPLSLSHWAKPHKNWIFIISPSLHFLPTTSSNDIDIIGSEMNFNVQLTGCLAFIAIFAIPFLLLASISASIAGTFCYWTVENFISYRTRGKKVHLLLKCSLLWN